MFCFFFLVGVCARLLRSFQNNIVTMPCISCLLAPFFFHVTASNCLHYLMNTDNVTRFFFIYLL